MHRHLRARAIAGVAAVLIGLAAFAPVQAAPDVRPIAVAASAGPATDRWIVVWRTPRVGGVHSSRVAREIHGANRRRSVVISKPGEAASLARDLRADPDILAVVPDATVTVLDWPASAPNDPSFAGSQPDLPLMGVPTAWLTTTGKASTVIAVLDTGMQRTHADLDGIHVVSPFNEITGTTDVRDGHGHGTHVIGEIAAETNNGLGIAGIAPGVSIMPVKVLADNGSGSFSDILDGIDWARTHGANVISMSLGGPLPAATVAAFQPTFDAAYAAGITIVAAAGNNGNGTISYPAAFDHVLSVAATDNADRHASFSNSNAFVDLSAPGVSILSTTIDGGYGRMSGTSMSTPHVAAVAGLILSAHPTESVDQVEAALRATAVDLGTPGRDDIFGSGRVDAAAAVAWTPPAPGRIDKGPRGRPLPPVPSRGDVHRARGLDWPDPPVPGQRERLPR
jgi:subtilisin family serine protease